MKTTVKQLAFAALALLAIVLVLSSFKPAQRNSIANGSGMSGSIHFDFNAAKQKDGSVVGHIQYSGVSYIVDCGVWYDNYAILFTTDGHAFFVADNGQGGLATDYISDPLSGVECGDLLSQADFGYPHMVTSGNIQVKQ
jgi:hypothetical protein